MSDLFLTAQVAGECSASTPTPELIPTPDPTSTPVPSFTTYVTPTSDHNTAPS